MVREAITAPSVRHARCLHRLRQKRNGKFLALKPSSPPEDIKDKLGLSKSYVHHLATCTAHGASARAFLRRQFKTAVHELRKANRLIVSEEGVSLLPSKRTKRGGGEEAALLRRHKAAARASILARVPEAEEAYGLRAAADEALHLLPPSARNALLELPGGVRHGVPQTLAPHKRAARLRRQRQGMRASAVVNDPANRMVFALEEEPAFVEGSGGAPSSGAGLAPPVPPGMKAVAGRSTLSPAKQAELRRMEKEGDFEVLDTYVPADKPQTPPPQAAASMQEARQEPSSAPAAPVPLRAVAQAVDSMARKKRGGAAAANSVLIQDQGRLEELLEVAPGEVEEGEQSDLAYFMRVLGEDVGQYGDIFSEGEQGVQEALAHPNILHLRRAVAEGSVDPATLTGSTRAALAESLRSSRIPEHRHVLARIRALESGAEGDER